MDDTLRVFVDQLKGGKTKEINLTVTPASLESDDKSLNRDRELRFDIPISIVGEVYLAQDDLVLHLDLSTKVVVPCNICNESISVPLEIHNLYLSPASEEIKGAVFDMSQILREEILLGLPQFTECEGGKCPMRKEILPFLKKKSVDEDKDEYHPFADL